MRAPRWSGVLRPGTQAIHCRVPVLYSCAAPLPVTLCLMRHTHCAGYSSPGQAAQPCVSEFIAFVSSKCTAAASEHV